MIGKHYAGKLNFRDLRNYGSVISGDKKSLVGINYVWYFSGVYWSENFYISKENVVKGDEGWVWIRG